MLVIVTIVLITLNNVCTLPISQTDMDMAMNHLKSFGYMAQSTSLNSNAMKTSIENYQTMLGLERTGAINIETVEMMKRPRCGMLDMMHGEPIQGTLSKYNGTTLWYKLEMYPMNSTGVPFDEELRKAFNIWMKYIDHPFIATRRRWYNAAVRFSYRNHGDASPFDGRGQVVGHATYPRSTMHFTHFDADEEWSTNSDDGVNFYQTAVHEIGHMLGLNHSNIPTSVMYGTYMGYQRQFLTDLDKDDINRIQALYGPRKKPLPETHIFYFDLVFDGTDNTKYVFIHDLYIKYGPDLNETERGCIRDKWKDLPLKVDAAFETSNGRMFFFKGNEYWRYTNFSTDEGYPKMIFQGFRGIKYVDVALPWGEKVLFFKDSKVFEFDPKIIEPVERNITQMFTGVPSYINSAIKMGEDKIYFFRLKHHFIFDLKSNSTVKTSGCPFFPCFMASRNINSCCVV